MPSFQQQSHCAFLTQSQRASPSASGLGPPEDNSTSSSSLLIGRLQRATTADPGEHHSEENKRTENLTGLHSGTQKKPRYTEVLGMWAKNSVPHHGNLKPMCYLHDRMIRLVVSKEEGLRFPQRKGCTGMNSTLMTAQQLGFWHSTIYLHSCPPLNSWQVSNSRNRAIRRCKLSLQHINQQKDWMLECKAIIQKERLQGNTEKWRDEDDDQSSDGEFWRWALGCSLDSLPAEM